MTAAENLIELDEKIEQRTIDKFVALKKQIDILQEELDSLKPEVLKIVDSKLGQSLCCDGKWLTISKRGTYEYSDKVYKLEKMVKEMKKGEEQSGICKMTTVKKYIVVK